MDSYPARDGAPSPRPADLVHVALTQRETRALVRASALVVDVLRPELFRDNRSGESSPLVTACQVLLAACERAGVEIGITGREAILNPR